MPLSSPSQLFLMASTFDIGGDSRNNKNLVSDCPGGGGGFTVTLSGPWTKTPTLVPRSNPLTNSRRYFFTDNTIIVNLCCFGVSYNTQVGIFQFRAEFLCKSTPRRLLSTSHPVEDIHQCYSIIIVCYSKLYLCNY